MATQEQVMERALKGNERLQKGMERSAIDMTQTAHTIDKQLERALEKARTRTQIRERER
jgi:hypothetical protein